MEQPHDGSEHDGDTSENVSATDFDADVQPLVERDENVEVAKLVARETKGLKILNAVVSLVIVIVAGAVTTATFRYLSAEEEGNFEDSFHQLATTIADASDFRANSLRTNFGAFSDQLTSHALATNRTWPFVYLPFFDVHAATLRERTGCIALWTTPLVDFADKDEYETFVEENTEYLRDSVARLIFYIGDGQTFRFDVGPGPYAPVLQTDPDPVVPIVNFDVLLGEAEFRSSLPLVRVLDGPVVVEILSNSSTTRLVVPAADDSQRPGEPLSIFLQPVYDSFDTRTRRIVALVQGFIRWGDYLTNLLPSDTKHIFVVLESSCNQTRTYRVNGTDTIYLGEGERHDRRFDHLEIRADFKPVYERPGVAQDVGACVYRLRIYPSKALQSIYTSRKPAWYTGGVALIFGFMALSFLTYDTIVRRRNKKVIETAAKSSALVSSMFPDAIRDRLMANNEAENHHKSTKMNRRGSFLRTESMLFKTDLSELKNYLTGGDGVRSGVYDTKPIADLFLETTIMFGDIVGFTAWSSVREPSQVFSLLETIYAAFDVLSKKRNVFKVETVGDCYVAVTGLPEPRKDHAVAMARFARDCQLKLKALLHRLELSHGPDTADLGIRIGLHSGPITAGVLRGERSRFQLFGDTINTTARIESTGEKDKIHCSQETASFIEAAGKAHWLVPRGHMVEAKGKGFLQTYWLELKRERAGSITSMDSAGGDQIHAEMNWARASLLSSDVHQLGDKTSRLINWNVEVLLELLKEVVARRNALGYRSNFRKRGSTGLSRMDSTVVTLGVTVLDEVKEIIKLPKFNAEAAKNEQSSASIELEPEVVDQLRQYVSRIAQMYRENSFHNFEHASHVAMSVTKLLARIVRPAELDVFQNEHKDHTSSRSSIRGKIASSLHDHTYGITSDPLTRFAVVFSALIHDVDHTGVPNSQLVRENATIAELYMNKSVAEQNSVDLAWDMFMDDEFSDLRDVLCATDEEHNRFRQLVVNVVLATDIVDKELKALRNGRWEKAFNEQSLNESPEDTVNRKATIVIEHLIQASDVAHTMQHWNIYRKWNARFFEECYKAYREGRADKDPSEGWYTGEMGFFDFYIIPLAKKLKDCGVFGVASDEYLNYAKQNRRDWEARGQEIVAEMLENYNSVGKQEASPAETKAVDVDSDGHSAGSERLGQLKARKRDIENDIREKLTKDLL